MLARIRLWWRRRRLRDTDVYLKKATERGRGSRQFEAYSCESVSLAWLTDEILQISYGRTCNIGDFNSRWWLDPGTDSPRSIEVVLKPD